MEGETSHRGGAAKASRGLAIMCLIAVMTAPFAGIAASVAGSPTRTVRVGVYQNEPKVFADDEGRAAGIFVELLEAVAHSESWALEFRTCTWAECLAELEAGRLDLMPDVAYSRERGERFDFNRVPILESWSQMYARRGVEIEDLSDLRGRRVALLEGSIQQAAFAQMVRGFGLDTAIVAERSLGEAFAAAASGEVDAAVGNHFFGDYFYAEYGLVKTPIVFQVAELHVAAAHGRNADLLAAVDRHVGAWRGEPGSAYYETLGRWMERRPEAPAPAYLRWLAGAALFLLLLAAAAILLLRRQVRARSSRLERAAEERRVLEAQLRQSQKMEAMGRLAGGVAHDFNNLLMVILSYSELAIQRLAEGDPARMEMREVARAGQRAATLTRQLLAFSRKQALDSKPVDLNRTVVELEKMLRRVIGEDVAIELRLAPALGTVSADPGQLEQVIVNLAINARDAMPTGGKLTIETANAAAGESEIASGITRAAYGPHVALTVRDTGCGMDDETSRRAFEPFFTTKEPGKGTGLGLSTVRDIVEQYGGAVHVESEIGRGTAFVVRLPCSPVEASARSAAPGDIVRSSVARTVLVVDDDEAVRGIIARLLRENGFEVLTAADGEEALRVGAERAGEVHVLITDAVMPGMSGATLIARMEEIWPGVRAILMSGYSVDLPEGAGAGRGGAPFLSKPFGAAELTRKIAEVLGVR